MEHEMEVVEEGERLLDGKREEEAAKEQTFSRENTGVLQNPGAVPCTRQRSRRRHDPARPWKSLPPTPTGGLEANQPVFFSSMTSLQAEEFFDMVATAQARRLNDQRADFAGAEGTSGESVAVSEDQLYDTILSHQSQRLEDQRTEPPIPVGVQGLLDLLLRAQGTRMEDQRSVLPPGLAATRRLPSPARV
ncbi:G-protein-signaling modulator 3 [Sphaerodactylus townsendi]|uniref:G-protein-signaling modulator 3 n=1 Tax=Sphaerodactylus townsendi TaxID=933632 RepID=UPI002025D623|nr:G-protein-signaling modulator 3 [Sphaerodactylus townsendi]XP_048345513.1 G-protein-signaling modulator 3 [Sphaerodactylus townsendi]